MSTVAMHKDFDRFLSNRNIISRRIEANYTNVVYPARGFLQHSPDAGKLYRAGSVNNSSPDVLIPAFLAAYQGKDAEKISLSPFPSVKTLVPNWRVVYDGLVRLPFLKDNFQTILLSHQYRGVYNVAGYSSYLNRVEAGEGKGFIPASPGDPSPVPAAAWQISNVSIADGFTPVIGVDVTTKNNITVSSQYNKSRHLNLSITAVQLMESYTREFTLGIGYKTKELYKLIPRFYRRGTEKEWSVRMDFVYRKNGAWMRKIEETSTQMISGNYSKVFHFLSEYTFSRLFTVRTFLDVEIDVPVFSATLYPSYMIQGGISLILTFN
ncbi:MAG: cell surface protein SprA [Tannerellaceae bacterium]|nr:cell surface protein SprA [Tannerellaceae bacterium]